MSRTIQEFYDNWARVLIEAILGKCPGIDREVLEQTMESGLTQFCAEKKQDPSQLVNSRFVRENFSAIIGLIETDLAQNILVSTEELKEIGNLLKRSQKQAELGALLKDDTEVPSFELIDTRPPESRGVKPL